MLQDYRILDLTDGEAQLCGRILADLGADVIRVEKPGGDPSRHTGPFYKDIIDPEKGLWWFVLNANKRGITLNLESQDGRELFKKLVKDADFVIESFPPGYLANLGLDYRILVEINSRIIVTSMTPFGQTGPYKDFKAPELVLMALGVFMYGTGDPDRPPVKPNYPLAGIASAIHASSATMIAHYYRTKTGKGQYIDVSAQAGVPWFTGNVGAWWQMEKKEIPRMGPYMARRPDLKNRFIWPCQDGYVIFQFYGGAVGRSSNLALAQWLTDEGVEDEYYFSIDWNNLDLYKVTQDVISRLEKTVGDFLLKKDKQELAEEATRRGVILGYISEMRDLFQNPQLESRYFWKDISHSELHRSITYPGFFAKSSLEELSLRHRAPLIGEHNGDIFGEIGVSKEQLLSLSQDGTI